MPEESIQNLVFGELERSRGKIAVLELTFIHYTYERRKTTRYQTVVGEICDCTPRKTLTGEDGYYLKFNSLLFLKDVENPIKQYKEAKKNSLETPEYVRNAVYSGITPENFISVMIKDRKSGSIFYRLLHFLSRGYY